VYLNQNNDDKCICCYLSCQHDNLHQHFNSHFMNMRINIWRSDWMIQLTISCICYLHNSNSNLNLDKTNVNADANVNCVNYSIKINWNLLHCSFEIRSFFFFFSIVKSWKWANKSNFKCVGRNFVSCRELWCLAKIIRFVLK